MATGTWNWIGAGAAKENTQSSWTREGECEGENQTTHVNLKGFGVVVLKRKTRIELPRQEYVLRKVCFLRVVGQQEQRGLLFKLLLQSHG